MLLSSIALLAACAYGFEDTSPLIYLSTQEHQQPLGLFSSSSDSSGRRHGSTVQSGASFQSSVLAQVDCSVLTTVVAVQPSIHASDLSSTGDNSGIQKLVNNAAHTFLVPYGHGDIDPAELATKLATHCDAALVQDQVDGGSMSHPVFDEYENESGTESESGNEGKISEGAKRVVVVTLPSLPMSSDARQMTLADNGAFLTSFLRSLPRKQNNLVYVSTPPPAAAPGGSFRRSRDTFDSTTARRSNGTNTDNKGGLFSRYQYFTPGIFMGYMAFILLVPILIIAIGAVASVQISYRAFDPPLKVGPKQG
ncbi:hypothetical protein PYCC9005_004872 [Savitreella phatthalungensis]